ncbi:hypothetical protein IGI04_035956 [Brassica rapa subsp. trilocularis]|uniref:Uncharacterized protein n=1 Tax=Brassica rapa subsp. trilocularis TaxID=1813537 RepID=A0ABQ7LGW3_BRACM|nr:hypothetical protein IGI04_035956 [Brassica rapa subsp. trilocularis]
MNIFKKSNPCKDIFTKSLAVKSFSNLNRTTKYDYPKATDMYPNRPRTSSSMAIGPQTSQARSIRGDQACTQLGRYVATERPSRSDRARAKARSLSSDRASVPLGRYVATELEPSSRPSSSQARSLRSDRASVPLGRYVATELKPKLGLYVATERPSRLVAT